ncbi:hypothetical protein [Candidatus Symbiothrix dinenymphae]|uniref:hypothetical protein n=1 Tax=Candidatus Symbiothrix dinenymphae TaxID=467085 RepID=UPI0006E44005|nr:hypothetical protein [Candidatus Symbiothrix dinenymphae]
MYGQVVALGKEKRRISVIAPRTRYRQVVGIEKGSVSAAIPKSSLYEDFKSEDEMDAFIAGFAKEYFND